MHWYFLKYMYDVSGWFGQPNVISKTDGGIVFILQKNINGNRNAIKDCTAPF